MANIKRINHVTLVVSDLEEACARLVALANARGGDDNVTVALVRCEEV